MKVQNVIGTLEILAPPVYQEHYDNAGLLTGNSDWEVTNALLTLDCTETVVKEAIDKKCNLIIAHHPLIFGGLKQLTGNHYVQRAVILAIKNDIAIYAAHTNLDNMLSGVNKMICNKLGIEHPEILSKAKNTLKKLFTFVPHAYADKIRQALFEAGAGNIGNYSEASFNADGTGTFKGNENTHAFVGKKGEPHHEPETKIEVIFPKHLETIILNALLAAHPYEEVAYDIVSLDNSNQEIGSGMIGDLSEPIDELLFLQKIKRVMKADVIRYTPLLGKSVKKVAVCGGAGSFLLKDAIRAKADIFISADFKYHEFFDADNQIVIADIGHFESEQFTVDLFYDYLTEKLPTFAPLKSESKTNPINYLH